VHFLRLSRARPPRPARAVGGADPPDLQRRETGGGPRLSEAVATLEGKLPKVAGVLEAAEDDILAFYAFPADHWRKMRSTNPLERFNREIGRRTDVVGIFPDDRSLIRLASMLAIEQNDEWLVGRRYLSAASMGPLLEERPHRHTDEEVLELQPA
jgi:putative transposase